MAWKQTVGRYGYTVTVEQRGKTLRLRYWNSAKAGWERKSLKHADRAVAVRQARALSAELSQQQDAQRTGALTVAALVAMYLRGVSAHKAHPSEDQRRAELWVMWLGGTTDVAGLDVTLLEEFVRQRRAGAVTVPDRKLRKKVTDTTVGADIVFLLSVMNWAVRKRLLLVNPLRGFKPPASTAPKRPVATYDRYLIVTAERCAWPRGTDDAPFRLFRVFLSLVEATGWRVTALCKLRAEDVDRKADKEAPFGRLRKRAETDKEKVDQWVPLSKDARSALDELAILGGYLFPAPKDPTKPMSRWHARDLLEKYETAAGLAALDGGDFHAYRRKWATERKHLPMADVMAAGGWRDDRSLKQSYMQVDAVTLLAVVTEPRKLRDAK